MAHLIVIIIVFITSLGWATAMTGSLLLGIILCIGITVAVNWALGFLIVAFFAVLAWFDRS